MWFETAQFNSLARGRCDRSVNRSIFKRITILITCCETVLRLSKESSMNLYWLLLFVKKIWQIETN